jgi:enamine deaminase RidA (YjgF/YER057c/UK114 family)
MAPRRFISSGSTFEAEIGYSRAIVDREWIFVSGTTGFDYNSMTIAESVVDQAEQCLKNIDWALSEAGANRSDIVRVRYILPNQADFPKCWPVRAKRHRVVRVLIIGSRSGSENLLRD